MLRKLPFIAAFCLIFLANCSAPVRRHEQYPRPLPAKSAKLLVAEASKHIGEPYRYGGLSRKGWDCSGFVRTMYKRSLDIILPRSADDMYRASLPIPPSACRQGDLVFFNIRHQKASHVGIYMGNNRFIHVSRSDGVVVSTLNDPYYRRFYIGVRRLAPELVASVQ